MNPRRQRVSRYRKALEQWRGSVAELHERLAKAEAGHAHAKRFLELGVRLQELTPKP